MPGRLLTNKIYFPLQSALEAVFGSPDANIVTTSAQSFRFETQINKLKKKIQEHR